MVLSFSEKRAQTRVLRAISCWLNPQSRSCDHSRSGDLTVEDLEKLCGPFQNVQFDADLFYDILKSTFDMAEGFIVEYAATMGRKLTEFQLSADYSLVSKLPNGDPGKELNLTLSVLQSIVNGNESISTRAEITERLEKLAETKANLEKDGSEIPKVFTSIEDRIKYCDNVSEEEIQEFIDEMDKDENYQEKLSAFVDREYLLKGVNHAQILQKAYLKTTTMNLPFYHLLFTAMQSIVNRLSDEEMKELFETSVDHFKAVIGLKREFVKELKETAQHDKKGIFTARVLLRGPRTASEELAKLLHSHESHMELCIQILRDLPAPLYKILFEDSPPFLLITLFSEKGLFASSSYNAPMNCLVLSGILPLHKLLTLMNSPNFTDHLKRIFSGGPIRTSLKEMSLSDVGTSLWEDTVQSIINCLSILATRKAMPIKDIKYMILLVKTKSGDDSDEASWLSKYKNFKSVGQYTRIIPKSEEPAKESVSNESTVKEEKMEEEVKKIEDVNEMKEEEVERNDDETVKVEEKKEGEKTTDEVMMKEETVIVEEHKEQDGEKIQEEIKKCEDEAVKVEIDGKKKEEETPKDKKKKLVSKGEKKRRAKEEKEKREREEKEKREREEKEQREREASVRSVNAEEKANNKVSDVPADDEKETKAELEQKSADLVNHTGQSEKGEGANTDQVSRDLARRDDNNGEQKVKNDQVLALRSLITSIATVSHDLIRHEDTNEEEKDDNEKVSDSLTDDTPSPPDNEDNNDADDEKDEDYPLIPIRDGPFLPAGEGAAEEQNEMEEEEDEGNEDWRLAATQSSTHSQDGFGSSLNGSGLEIDKI